MPLIGIIFDDIDYTQINSVMDIADKKVNTYRSPNNISMNLSLSDNPNKVAAIQRLLSELDKRNLFGKIDVNFTNTKFSSEEIEKITKMMNGYKEKPINFSFDTNVNNFSQQDTMNILNACNGSKSTCYPFTTMVNDGLTPELRQQFLEDNPNIIYTPGNSPNFGKLKNILGFSSNDIRGEIVNGANDRKMSASEYANYVISSMDTSKLQELQKYSSAIERLSMEYSSLSIGNLQQKGYDDENIFFKTIKNALDSRIKTAENEKNQEATQQTTSNNNQTHEPNSTDTLSTENQKSENKITLEEIQKKYYNHIDNNTGSADELWHMANYLEQNDKSGEYTKHIVYAVVDRDPTFNSETMLGIVSRNVFDGYTDFDAEDEIRNYSKDAEVIGLLAEHNPNLSSASLLSTLNKISKETVSCYADNIDNNDVRTAFSTAALTIIPAYGKCEYDTPKQAETALQNITHITKSLDAIERNPHDVINSVYSIVNNTDGDKNVAKSAFEAVNLIAPQNSEEASKLLSLYKTISLDNPDMAEALVMKMRNIFNNFPEDEKLQKECLSTLETLKGFSSRFDEETKQKIDVHSKSMKSKIDAETIKRAQGKETAWKAPAAGNPQRNSTNTQFNYNNRYSGR